MSKDYSVRSEQNIVEQADWSRYSNNIIVIDIIVRHMHIQ